MSLTLGIDLGTTACRAAVLDEQGHCVAMARSAIPSPIKTPLGTEQDPQLWWQACQHTLTELFTTIAASDIAAIAIDGTSSTLLLCSPEGQAYGPALMYNDSRATKEAEQLGALAPTEAAVHSPSSSLAKLLWLESNQLPNKAFLALHQADWLMGHFSGHYGISDENNALKLGYDPVNRQWPEWIKTLQLPKDCLPTVVPAGQSVGLISAEMVATFNFSKNCQIIAGTTDSTASFLASGASKVNEAVTTLGSTLVVKLLSDKPVFAPHYGIYSHRLGDQWLVGGASNSGCAILREYFTDQQIVQLSTEINIEKECPLDYYPLIGKGERFPINDPNMQGCLEPRPDDDHDFLYGMLDGIARIEARGYQRLQELGAPPPISIRSVGGGAKNLNWEKIRARHLLVPMLKADFEEAACGSARLARAGLDKSL